MTIDKGLKHSTIGTTTFFFVGLCFTLKKLYLPYFFVRFSCFFLPKCRTLYVVSEKGHGAGEKGHGAREKGMAPRHVKTG